MSLPSEPITRKEQYLAKAAGQAVEIPAEPITREEAYLDAIAKGSGGGGGGTSDYSQLINKPQINGTTLTGNKSASDLSLATTADLAGKVDKVEGYGLSENDYTDADKAIVGGVTAALAGKQGALTEGNNIKIDNNTISVNRWAVPAGKVVYTVITSDENYGQNVHVQRHTPSGGFIDDRTFLCEMYKTVNVDDLISIYNPYSSFRITLLEDSDEQQAGYNYTVNPITTPTSNSFTFLMEQEENANDLIIRSELDAEVNAIKDGQSIDSFADVETALAGKQDALTFDDVPTDNSNNPVKSNGIYDALATKQNATDNSLDTTAKTIVGAINEHEGDIDSLKSGLTNLDVDIDAPNRKNLLPLSISEIKTRNTGGTWAGNVYTLYGITFTINTDIDGNITSVVVTGTATAEATMIIVNSNTAGIKTELNNKTMIFSGCPAGGSSTTYNLFGWHVTPSETNIRDSGDGVQFTGINTNSSWNFAIIIGNGYEIPSGGLAFYPMLRLSTVSDPTFAPYIPSVESRIEAVESGLTNVQNRRNAYNISTAESQLDTNYTVDLPNGYTRLNTMITGINIYKYSTVYSEKNLTRDNDLDCSVTIDSNDKLVYRLIGSSTVGSNTYIRIMVERID